MLWALKVPRSRGVTALVLGNGVWCSYGYSACTTGGWCWEYRSAPRGSAGSPGNVHITASLLQPPRAVLQPGWMHRVILLRREEVPAASLGLSPCPLCKSRASGAGTGPQIREQQALHGRALAGRSGFAWEGASWNMQIPVRREGPESLYA